MEGQNKTNKESQETAMGIEEVERQIEELANDLEKDLGNTEVSLHSMLTLLKDHPEQFKFKHEYVVKLHETARKYLELKKGKVGRALIADWIQDLYNQLWPEENAHPIEKLSEKEQW